MGGKRIGMMGAFIELVPVPRISMTKGIIMITHIPSFITAVFFVSTLQVCTATACAHPRDLRTDFSAREAHLIQSHRAQKETLSCAHMKVLEALKCARKQALQLCKPERAVALKQIRCHRRDAIKAYDCRLRQLNVAHRTARKAMRTEFRMLRQHTRCQCVATKSPNGLAIGGLVGGPLPCSPALGT